MSSSSSTTFRGLELVPRTPRDARDTEAQQHATLSHSSSESMLGAAGPRHLRGMKNIPLGMDLLHRSLGRKFNYNWYKASVLIITFLAYMGYHASRKPPSIVKSVLRGPHGGIAPSTAATAPSANYSAAVRTGNNLGRHLFAPALEIEEVEIDPSLIGNGWAPFNARNGQTLLGQVDLCFLGVYAIGMFFAGHLGDRMDLRIFLTAGMLLSGIFICLFGAGYFVDNHQASYYMLVSAAAGLFQSTGWPSVVAIVANWSGKGKRGLVMGIWNAHTSMGNILGTMIAASCLSAGWGWAFIVPGLLMIFLAAVVFLFLVVQPSDVGFTTPQDLPPEEMEALILKEKEKEKASGGEVESIAFLDAWRIPGVASYAACLFFSKLIAYTFLYWLPYYIKSTPIEGRFLSPKEAGDLSVLFDVGGVAGGVLAGHLSDKSGASALVATSFTLLAVPCLYLYRSMGYMSFSINILLMMLSGFFVNGPYALITTAVSADLGTHESLQGNAKALATVSAIIDGMGSIGAAIGPMMTGVISEWGGFDMVFAMLYTAAFTAGLLIIKLAARELGMLRTRTLPPGK